MPINTDIPLVLLATGTGIAPYISFFQELQNRKKQNLPVNKTILFFGSKNRKYDFIFEEELTKYKEEGIIERIVTAFSRDQEKKIYLQNLVSDNAEDLKKYAMNGILYLCGGVSMGLEVTNELEKILGKDEMKKLENESRFIKELWGK